MGPPILQMIKLLFDPNVSKKMILQLVFKQVKAIGYLKVLALLLEASIVGASTIIKVPQIRKIIGPKLLNERIKVAGGLSLDGISLESFNYLVHILYNRQQNNLFLGYGEAACLGFQNIIIMLLIEYYKTRRQLEATSLGESEKFSKSLRSLIKPLGVIAAFIIVLSKIAPDYIINGLQVLNIPLSIISKIPQIKKNYNLQSTEHLSQITVSANILGSLARVFATIQNFDKLGRDYLLLSGYSISLALNAAVGAQCIYYANSEKTKEE